MAAGPADSPPAVAGPAMPLEPGLEEARGLAREGNVVPVRLRLVDDCETPVSAFLKLRAAAAGAPCFLLESAEQGQVGRYSFLGFRPRATLRWSDGVLSEWAAGDSPGDEPSSTTEAPDPCRAVSEHLSRYRLAADGDLPPFAGGAVGFFAYDLVRTVEPLGEPNPDELGLPDLALMLSDVLVAFDHLKHRITILANVYADEDLERSYAAAAQQIAEVRAALAGPVPPITAHGPRPAPAFQPNMPRETFEAMVARIVEYVHAGDAFQVVPSQRWRAPVDVEPFSIYRGLRAVNPSPYMYYLDFGDFQVAGASPEPLLTVKGRNVSTRPIAGTRPRGRDLASDERIAAELLADDKERAEHVMLVDLGRNDLGRVCEYGSVTVDDFMIVETYSTVMHIVSNVSGRLREGIGAMDALRSVLPAGTLSGAPKVRAMQIIDELEPIKRGGYGGADGYPAHTGDPPTGIPHPPGGVK